MASKAAPSDTMLAAVLEQFGQPYTLKQIPRPSHPHDHDLLIKVQAASYCHTDAVFASGALSKDLPRIGCHEFAGEIVALGENVPKNLHFSIGTRVGVPGRAYHPCTTCYECTHPEKDKMGYSPFCPRAVNLGLTQDGGFQEYCLVDSRQVAPIPDGMSAIQAAPLMCAGLTIWAALHHEKLRQARKIAILGAGGGLGHLGVQFAIRLGMSVLAIDANDKSLDLLQKVKKSLGPAGDRLHIADVRKDDTSAMRLMMGEVNATVPPSELGLDAAIILPESQAAFDTGMKLLKNHGTMVIVSFPENGFHFSARDLVFRDISLVGSLVGRNYQLAEMLQFCQEHGVSADVQSFPFAQINELVAEYHKGVSGKLVIDTSLYATKSDN
jgi:propanol-preferring alcohol dehydrogenase